MKKKIFVFMMFACLLLPGVFLFAGCNHSHDWVTTKWVNDRESHWHECRGCNEKMDEASHELSWVISWDSSCTTEGLKLNQCTICGYTFSAETIAKKEHDMTEWAEKSPATCTEAQVLERHCTTCTTQNETKEGTAALGHTESSWIMSLPPSCTGGVLRYKNCTRCNIILESGYYKLEHSMTEWAEKSPATCTEAQVLERHCTTCATKNETKEGEPATGHTESDWIIDKDSTCTSTGTRHKECTVCETTISTETITKKEHDMTEWAEKSPATCTEAQVLERHCTTCATKNETKEGEPATGHTESDWIVETAPTCSKYGVSYKECSVCHEELERDTQVAKLQHTESDWIIDKDSTCTSTGTRHKECTVCETTISTETIAKKEHDMTEWAEKSPATCTEAQVLERHCTTCETQNETKEGEPATGHTWVNGKRELDGNYYVTTQTCACGATNEIREECKTIYLDVDCSISIKDCSNLKVVIGEKVELSLNVASGYIVEKLVYVEGTFGNSGFTATGEEKYIYNNSFVMPNSDVQIICRCVKRTQKATINDNKALLTSNMWMPSNMTLDSVSLSITDGNFTSHQLINVSNLNYQGQTCYQEYDIDLDEIELADNKIGVDMSVGFTFYGAGQYNVPEDGMKFFEGVGSSAVTILSNGLLTYEQTYTISVWNIVLNSRETKQVTFRISMYLNIKNQHRVTYISESDNVENVTLYTGDLISIVPNGEWYTDQTYTTKWDFANNQVTTDVVLYKKEA